MTIGRRGRPKKRGPKVKKGPVGRPRKHPKPVESAPVVKEEKTLVEKPKVEEVNTLKPVYDDNLKGVRLNRVKKIVSKHRTKFIP